MPKADSTGQAVVAVCLVFPILAALAICARFQARKVKKFRLQTDDWVIALSWVISTGMAITYIVGVYSGGIGYSYGDLDLTEVTIFTKVLFAGQFFYLFSVGSVKVSIVLFYKRVFLIESFARIANILLLIIGLWLTAFFFTTLFQSWPISQNWTGVGRNLMNYPDMYLALGVIDLVMDVMILCTPLPIIKNLRIRAQQKVAVACILGVGFLCVIASAVRIYYLHQISSGIASTFSWSVVQYVIWSQIEACWSIVCACLPTLGPLFRGGRSPESIVNSVIKRCSDSLKGSKRKLSSESNSSGPEPYYENRALETKCTCGSGETYQPGNIVVHTTLSTSEEKIGVK